MTGAASATEAPTGSPVDAQATSPASGAPAIAAASGATAMTAAAGGLALPGAFASQASPAPAARDRGALRPGSAPKPLLRSQSALPPVEQASGTPSPATPSGVSLAAVAGAAPEVQLAAPNAPGRNVPLPDEVSPRPVRGGGSPASAANAVRPAAPAAEASATAFAGATPESSAGGSGGGRNGQPLEIAFTATLSPAGTAPEDASAELAHADSPASPRRVPAAVGAQPLAPETADAPGATAAPAADYATPPAEGISRPAPSAGGTQQDEERKPQENAVSAPAAASLAHMAAGAPGAADVRPAVGNSSGGRPEAAEPPPQAASPQSDPAAPARPAAAHDIQLQVGGEGASRVEVRVTERAGDVHVSVSTADTRLAGEMRQDLPALSARLEQSGFHAQTWQPAAGGRQQPGELPAGAAAQDAQSQSRQNGRGGQGDPQQQPRDPENPDNPSQPKEPGKDFAWLLSSLR